MLQLQRGARIPNAPNRRTRSPRLARSASLSPRAQKRKPHPQRRHAQSGSNVAAARRHQAHRAIHLASRSRHCRILDRYRVGRHDGVRRSQRHCRRATSARRSTRNERAGRNDRAIAATTRRRATKSASPAPRHRVAAAESIDRRLVVGRARDQRHDDGRARAAVPLSRPSARRVPRRRDRPHPAPSAQRRIVGALLRRPRRSEHDDRSLRRAQGARRRPPAQPRCAKRSQ